MKADLKNKKKEQKNRRKKKEQKNRRKKKEQKNRTKKKERQRVLALCYSSLSCTTTIPTSIPVILYTECNWQ